MKIFVQKLSGHIGCRRENMPQAITKKKCRTFLILGDDLSKPLVESMPFA